MTIHVTRDHLNKYPGMPKENYYHCVGFFLGNALNNPARLNIKDKITVGYKFETNWRPGHIKDEVFCYPGDQPSYPFCKLYNDETKETMLVFPRAIVAVSQDGKNFEWAKQD